MDRLTDVSSFLNFDTKTHSLNSIFDKENLDLFNEINLDNLVEYIPISVFLPEESSSKPPVKVYFNPDSSEFTPSEFTSSKFDSNADEFVPVVSLDSNISAPDFVPSFSESPKPEKDISFVLSNKSPVEYPGIPNKPSQLPLRPFEFKASAEEFSMSSLKEPMELEKTSPETDSKLQEDLSILSIESWYSNEVEQLKKRIKDKIEKIRDEGKEELRRITEAKQVMLSIMPQKFSGRPHVEIKPAIDLNQRLNISYSVEESIATSPSLSPKEQVLRSPSTFKMLFNSDQSKFYYSANLKDIHEFDFPISRDGSSVLILDATNILIYFPDKGEVLNCNITTKTFKRFPGLRKNRKFAAFSMINRYPALIGGVSNNENTDLVNVFDNGWKEIAKINFRRSHLQGTVHKGKTYIFGGLPKELNGHIERYSRWTWEIIKVKLPRIMNNFGLSSYLDEIFIIGGISEENNKELGVWCFNPEKEENFVEKGLKVSFVSQNPASSVIFDRKLFFLDGERGKVMRFDL